MDKQNAKKISWFEQTEECLYDYPMLCVQIRNLQEDLDWLDRHPLIPQKFGNIVLFGGEVSDGPNKWLEKKDKLLKTLSRKLTPRYKMARALAMLPPDESEFVERRYFRLESMQRIQMEMNYSERTLYRIRHRAVSKIAAGIGVFAID